MSDELPNITIPVEEPTPIDITVRVSSYEQLEDDINEINEHLEEIDSTLQNDDSRLDAIESSMPTSSVLFEVDYIDGTSEEFRVAVYEDRVD